MWAFLTLSKIFVFNLKCLQTDRKGNSTPGSKFAYLKEQIVPQGVAIGIVLMYCQLVAGEGAIFGYTAGVIHSCGLCVKETTFWAFLQGINIVRYSSSVLIPKLWWIFKLNFAVSIFRWYQQYLHGSLKFSAPDCFFHRNSFWPFP